MNIDNSFILKSDIEKFLFLIDNSELQYELSSLIFNMIRRRRALLSVI